MYRIENRSFYKIINVLCNTYSCLQSIKMAITNSNVMVKMAETTKIIKVPIWFDSSTITSGKFVEGLANASENKRNMMLIRY